MGSHGWHGLFLSWWFQIFLHVYYYMGFHDPIRLEHIFFQMGGFFLKFVGLDWANFPRLRNNGGARLEFLGVTFFRSTLDPDLQNPH